MCFVAIAIVINDEMFTDYMFFSQISGRHEEEIDIINHQSDTQQQQQQSVLEYYATSIMQINEVCFMKCLDNYI